jgi:Ca2+-binding EF-hand superfamily protein
MQLTAALAVLTWCAGQITAVARTGSLSTAKVLTEDFFESSSQYSHGRYLRRAVAEPEKTAKEGDGDAKPGKSAEEPQQEVASGQDNDTLTHELIDQATTQPVRKEFNVVDRNGDEKIDYWEYLASTRAEERVATYRFNCSDNNMDNVLDFNEFSESQKRPQDIERCMTTLLAFQMIDRNRDGMVTQTELWKSAGRSGVDFDGRWAFMVACSDLNRDGKVSPMEFSTDMYRCIQDRSSGAYNNFTKFRGTDSDSNGCADEDEMAIAVNKLMGLNLLSDKPPNPTTRRLSRRWMSCVDFDSNRCLTKKEYGGLLDPSPKQAQCIGTHYEEYEGDMDFEIMDTNDDRKVSKQEYYTWCSQLDIVIDHRDAEALFQSADKNNDGFIDESEFGSAGSEHAGDGPGYLFFLHGSSAHASKPRTTWRGSIRQTWAGFSEPST